LTPTDGRWSAQGTHGRILQTGYFDYDTTAKHCVLYTTRAKPAFWIYDVKANEWTPLEPAGEPPSGGYVIGYYDPARDVLVHYNSRDVYVCRIRKARP